MRKFRERLNWYEELAKKKLLRFLENLHSTITKWNVHIYTDYFRASNRIQEKSHISNPFLFLLVSTKVFTNIIYVTRILNFL